MREDELRGGRFEIDLVSGGDLFKAFGFGYDFGWGFTVVVCGPGLRTLGEDTADGLASLAFTVCMLSVWKVNKIVEVMYLQFPITAVLTTAVNNMSWFSAVLLVNRAVVYLSQNEVVF